MYLYLLFIFHISILLLFLYFNLLYYFYLLILLFVSILFSLLLTWYLFMQRRSNMSKRASSKSFKKGAQSSHRFNSPMAPRFVMRGGIRM